MERKIAVLVPGIMGSSLYENDGGRAQLTLWSENFAENYRTLARNEALLAWTGSIARARLIQTASFRRFGIGMSFPVWGRTIDLLANLRDFRGHPPIEFGYDWRQPIEDSATQLVKVLCEVLERHGSGTRLTLICHSMGGLVCRLALAKGGIQQSDIDRIVHIGTPLLGSPAAFGQAYGSLDFPLFPEVLKMLNGRNWSRAAQAIRSVLATCPSIFQLFPHLPLPYLYYSGTRWMNPFDDEHVPKAMIDAAVNAHQLLRAADTWLVQQGVKGFIIYGSFSGRRSIPSIYDVKPQGPEEGYEINEIMATNCHGDGTVPMDSALGATSTFERLAVRDVVHSTMCNDRRVVDLLQRALLS